MEASGFMYELSVYTGLSGDEMLNYQSATNRVDLSNNNLTPENTLTGGLWSRMYSSIYKANAIIEGLDKSTDVSAAVKDQLTGEALFVRAFFHHYLMRLFGDIPVSVTTNYLENASSVRQTESVVYLQIENDLRKAIELLSDQYVNANNAVSAERTRPNRFAAKALLARILLYQHKWAEAETIATEVINTSAQYSLQNDLSKVFLKNSLETIWQIQSVIPGFNTYAGAFFPFTNLPSTVSLSPSFVNNFETADGRRTAWIKTITVSGNNYSYPYKYRVWQNAASVTEYTMVLRLAELYLMRAETRARQSLFTLANADVNAIRIRAGLAPISHVSIPDLLQEIEKQRRYELFAEAGDRWMDLRRTDGANTIIGAVKGANWSVTDQLYPIPQTEINRNNLLTQNPGY
jgi:starch-binding outer membrane protein, SusD/RagB family